jgi:polar amino acid transport system substrate-binding protein
MMYPNTAPYDYDKGGIMKKLVLLVLGLVLIVGMLASCGGTPTTIRIATDATWPPFEYVNDAHEIVGLDIDLMNAIADEANLDIEFVNVAFDPLLAGMAAGTYDAAISSITILPDRQKDMLFSNPYYGAGQIVVVQKSNTTITSKNNLTGEVGAQLGTTGAIEVEKIAGATLVNYDDIGLAFQALMNGQVNAVVCDNPVAMEYVVNNPDKLKVVGTVFTDEFYGIAVAKGQEDLLEKINAGLQKVLEEGIIETLEEKWYQ